MATFDLVPVEDTPSPVAQGGVAAAGGMFDLVPVNEPPQKLGAKGGVLDTVANAIPDSVTNSMPFRALAGVGGGLVQRGLGAIQGGAEMLGADDTANAARGAISDVNQNLQGAGTVGQIGKFVGDVAPLALAPGVGVGALAEAATRPSDQAQGFGERAFNAATDYVGGKALEAIAPKVISAIRGGKSKTLATSDDFRQLAGAHYQAATDAGGVLKPHVTNAFLDDATAKLAPQTTAGKLLAGDSPAAKVAERLQTLKDKPISLPEAQEIDEYLGDQIDLNSEMGRLNKQGKKLLDLQSSLRNSIANASDADIQGGRQGFDSWNKGRNLYRTSMQLRDIEKIVSRADLSDNPATAVKSGFRTLASNPERMKGYDKETAGLIRKAAQTGIVGDALRIAGSRLIPIFAGAAGHIPGAFGAEAVGLAARSGANQLQLGRAANVTQSILRQGEQRLAAGPKVAPTAIAPEGVITRSPMSNQRGSANGDTAKALGVGSTAGLGGAAYFANKNRPGGEPNPEGQETMVSMPPPPVQVPVPVSATMPQHDELGDFIKSLPPAQAISRTVIAREEATRPKSYTDKNGFKTVGTGFNMDAPNAKLIWKRAGVPERFDDVYNGKTSLSNGSIQSLFHNTSAAAEKAAQKLVPNYDQLGDNQKAALNSLVFQLGSKGLGKFRNMLNYLAQGNAKAVENSLINSKLGQQDSPARARRTALMLAYDMPHEQADALLAQQGRIKPNQRKYR